MLRFLLPCLCLASAALALSLPLWRLTMGGADFGFGTDQVAEWSLTGLGDVIIMLDEEGRDWLARQTAAHVGEVAALELCGREVLAPVIHAPIDSGILVLQGRGEPFTEAVGALLEGRATCADLDPEEIRLAR
ncbi:hypothetical protein [Litorisediminicola beolgyonensis]|uniref:Uncharacterized protein n=1 Tax=Litorisediminicola beolgyonensis TaxID=1173614 RepID=A0ABW3ZMW6_9RHOB